MPHISRRTWKYSGLAVIAVGLVSLAYTPARQFHRFFLTPCAATGPVPETELEISAQPVDLASFYAKLRAAAQGLPMQRIEIVSYQGQEWPIYLIGADPAPANASTLVVAGVHGNEVSGSLAAVDLLVSMHARPAGAPPIHVLAPANPIGLAHASRYNSQGCDINRDFEAFQTIEARAIRKAVDRVRPRVVVALHEGPQDGVFVIGTQITPPALLSALVTELESQEIPLATENNLGVGLATPGLMREGSFITRAKGWLGIYSAGEYTSRLGIPLVTVEIPWSWPSMEQRIRAQAIAAFAAADSAAIRSSD